MKNRRFFIALQASGIIIFFAAVVLTILFAEGYQYDTLNGEFVKKSVVYFEGGLSGASVFLNGKSVEASSSGEIRAEPGNYELLIAQEGYFPWKKTINISEDEVLRFPKIRLLPASFTENSVKLLEKTNSWKLHSSSEEGFMLINVKLHAGKYYSFESPHKFQLLELSFGPSQLDAFAQKQLASRPEDNIILDSKKAADIQWMSRIGSTFHAVFVTKANNLLYCDEDFENCHTLGHLDSSFIQAGSSREVFLVEQSGHFTLFHFEEDGMIPKFLKKLVSFANG